MPEWLCLGYHHFGVKHHHHLWLGLLKLPAIWALLQWIKHPVTNLTSLVGSKIVCIPLKSFFGVSSKLEHKDKGFSSAEQVPAWQVQKVKVVSSIPSTKKKKRMQTKHSPLDYTMWYNLLPTLYILIYLLPSGSLSVPQLLFTWPLNLCNS